MKSFLKRVRQLRLRWKLAPIGLVIAVVGLSFYMRRPLVDFTLERVTQEGDWVRIECILTNTSNETVSLNTDSKLGTALIFFEYVEKIPIWWSGNRLIDENSFTLKRGPVGLVDAPRRDTEMIDLLKNEPVKAVGYIHRETANNEFIVTNGCLFLNSAHSQFEDWIATKAERAGISAELIHWVRLEIFTRIVPQRASFTLNPMSEISERTGEGLEQRVSNFMNQPVPPPCEYLIQKSDAYLNLKNFNDFGWEKFEWKTKSWDKWQDQIRWSLEEGTEPDPHFKGRSHSFFSAFWQDSDKFGPEIWNAKEYLQDLESLTNSLQRSLLERFSAQKRRALLKLFRETEMTGQEFAKKWDNYKPDN